MRFHLGLLFLLSPGCLFGWEPYKTDILQKSPVAISDGLDHLEPVDRKIPESPYLIQFIREPAKGFQYFHLTLTRDDKSGNFFLRSWSEWRKDDEVRPPTEVLGPSAKVEFPIDLASYVYAMWVNALLEVHYDRLSSDGLDGGTDLFSVQIPGRGWLHGAAWSPTKELPPKWMEDSANALIQFSQDKDEKKCRATLTELRDKLYAYLGASSEHETPPFRNPDGTGQ